MVKKIILTLSFLWTISLASWASDALYEDIDFTTDSTFESESDSVTINTIKTTVDSIIVDEAKYHLGEIVPYYSNLDHTFTICNSDTINLNIHRVEGTCAVQEIVVSDSITTPDNNASIYVRLNPQELNLGYFKQKIYVYSNAKTLCLTLSGVMTYVDTQKEDYSQKPLK